MENPYLWKLADEAEDVLVRAEEDLGGGRPAYEEQLLDDANRRIQLLVSNYAAVVRAASKRDIDELRPEKTPDLEVLNKHIKGLIDRWNKARSALIESYGLDEEAG